MGEATTSARKHVPTIASKNHQRPFEIRGLARRATWKMRKALQGRPERRPWRTVTSSAPPLASAPSGGRLDPVATSARKRSRGELRQPANPNTVDTTATAVRPPAAKDTAAARRATYASGTATNNRNQPARPANR